MKEFLIENSAIEKILRKFASILGVKEPFSTIIFLIDHHPRILYIPSSDFFQPVLSLPKGPRNQIKPSSAGFFI